MTKTCFILDELYPKDRGGIARLMHNVIHHAKSLDPSADLHIVLASAPPDCGVLQAAFQGIATLHFLRPDYQTASRFGLENLELLAIFPRQAEPALRELKVLDAVLHAIQESGPFDHIELPDHMGLGASILQAKRAGFGFQNTEITCRIHSTLSVIIEAEPFIHPRSDWLAPRLEMERFALEHADRVVAHLPTIARYNQAHFGFPPAWLDKVEISFPPVIWPAPAAPPRPAVGGDFIFTSRFQPFKRPELFIKAAITLLESDSDYAGKFRLISYGFTPEYIDYLRLMVPVRHHKRITIETDISAEDRLAAIANGIVVQPSKYESLCALAYEVSLENRPLLLARDCLAFADDPHWQDQKNCLFFEPTPEALATAMEAARTWTPSQVVETTPAAPYFLQPAATPAAVSPVKDVALLSGPARRADAAARIAAHFESQTARPRKVNLFGIGPLRRHLPNVAYHAFSEGGIAAQLWHDLAQNLTTDAIILHSPDALPKPAFLEEGARVVRPGVAYSSNAVDAGTGQMILYPGKFKTINHAEPRMCPPCIMLHKDDLFRLASSDDDDLIHRLITRLAQSDISLAFCPAPNVVERQHRPAPPQQRHLGYEASPLWQDGFRWVGISTRPSGTAGLLASQPIALILRAKTDLECRAEQPVQIDIDGTRVFALSPDHSMENTIFCLTISTEGAEDTLSVSLQKAFGATPREAAKNAHENGQNLRTVAGGQNSTLCWGPIWHSEPLFLVITTEKPTKLLIANPILTSRS